MNWSDVILSSQACQRNWDLSKDIPQEHIELIIESVTKCPSKQNLDFYEVYAITNNEIKEKIYWTTASYPGSDRYNSQVLANLLLVFVSKAPTDKRTLEQDRHDSGIETYADFRSIQNDVNQSIGIAVGFSQVIANALGYKTGCCKCFDGEEVRNILKIQNDNPIILMMGIGYPDETRLRNRDHLTDRRIGLYEKMPINVTWIK